METTKTTAPRPTAPDSERDGATPTHFIQDIIKDDLQAGRRSTVVTRFPPEPNGYLHIGHAKSICLNFGLARDYNGVCHLRFDDTNPETEDLEYVEAIKHDIRWLGFDWGDNEYYASDYFEQLYDWAVVLIKKGKAYVDSLSEEEIRAYRGTVTEPGRESPYRNRTVDENLALLEKMRAGAFGDGEHVLRARIDMASPNMLLRDPIMYRIRHADHYRRGDAWCLYPMYDWAHGQSDAIESISHSICTLEFEVHRPLYDWFVENLDIEPRPHQFEFARMNLSYMITSKRKLLQLVEENHVTGWDDPRMPTLAGHRRRGVTPEAIRALCDRTGVTKVNSLIDIGLLEYLIRDNLNYQAPRVMCVLRPLKVTITNYADEQEEWLEASYWPHDIPQEGTRPVPFSRTLYIEHDDFMETPSRRFRRLAPGREVRLRYAYVIRCDEVVKDEDGTIIELKCTYLPDTMRDGTDADRKVKSTIHWVSAAHALTAQVRLYDRLFSVPAPLDGPEDFKTYLNPSSREILTDCRIEPSVQGDPVDRRYQFERQGYFWRDPEDSSPDALVFNRIVPLRDTWKKINQASSASTSASESPTTSSTGSSAPAAAPRRRTRDEVQADLKTRSPEAATRFARYMETHDLPLDDARILAGDADHAAFFEESLSHYDNPKTLANWVIHAVLPARSDAGFPITPANLTALLGFIDDGTISTSIAKDVFAEMAEHGEEPGEIIDRKGLRQLSDTDVLTPIIAQFIEAYPDKVTQYRDGKTGLLGFFVGQVMRETSGKANPQLVKSLVEKALG